jgi:hypothetical protein
LSHFDSSPATSVDAVALAQAEVAAVRADDAGQEEVAAAAAELLEDGGGAHVAGAAFAAQETVPTEAARPFACRLAKAPCASHRRVRQRTTSTRTTR